MELKDLTNKDLQEYCDNEGIDVDSKNVSKPTKKEYLDAIGKHELQIQTEAEEFLEGSVLKDIEEEDDGLQIENKKSGSGKKEEKKVKPLTRSQKRRKQYNQLMQKKRVRITSNQDNQTKVKNSMFYVTWGNRLLGHQTDRIILDKPWHVRQGALDNLMTATVTESIQDEEGNKIDEVTKQAYIIQPLAPLSEQERSVIAKRQLIRDSSIDSLV